MKRTSENFVVRLDTQSAEDMIKLQDIRKSVSVMNSMSAQKFRVDVKGRKPFQKGVIRNPITGRVIATGSYGYGGNIIGGLANAQFYDVYIRKVS
jgi:hypothetical protein